LGEIHRKARKGEQSLAFYQQASAIKLKEDVLGSEFWLELGLARTYKDLKQSDRAITHYKAAIANIESLRERVRPLPLAFQQSYVQDTIEVDRTKKIKRVDIYREFADLLLSQNRVPEALQVMNLLKKQELSDLFPTRSSPQQIEGIESTPVSKPDRDRYNTLLVTAITDGKELEQLGQIPEANLTANQQQRILELGKKQQEISQYFNNFRNNLEVQKAVAQRAAATGGEILQLSHLQSLGGVLNEHPNTVVLYPMVFPDRIELVLTVSANLHIRRTVPVSREKLNSAISKFISDLNSPNDEKVRASARELYKLLIEPIERDLELAGAKTILYAPDEQLRYIPLSALYDGKQWLAERYAVNIITSDTLPKLSIRNSQAPIRVLAGALTKDVNVKIGDRNIPFKGLPGATLEVEKIASKISGTTKLIDAAFGRSITESKMSAYNIIHLATHGQFLPNNPKNSFIVFGDGKYTTFDDISWPVGNVNLVVLSACETALGGITDKSTGTEVLGLGFKITSQGAKTVIASLWIVNDGGTEALMDAFYTRLSQRNITTVEALRQAQVALISGKVKYGQLKLSHPYYWAPFILIGNGL
jgi:CHAT domain-containing protein